MTMRSQRRQSIPLEENETEQANKAIMASFYSASLNRAHMGGDGDSVHLNAVCSMLGTMHSLHLHMHERNRSITYSLQYFIWQNASVRPVRGAYCKTSWTQKPEKTLFRRPQSILLMAHLAAAERSRRPYTATEPPKTNISKVLFASVCAHARDVAAHCRNDVDKDFVLLWEFD